MAAYGRRNTDPVHSTHTLVHTPGTAGREVPAGRRGPRTPIVPASERGDRRAAPPGGARERQKPAAGALALERYRLLERLGAGGFGVVWRARDELLGREVALKRIPLADGDSERATREALAAARLAHPAIVALYEACATPDAFFLISELVRGDTLAQLIAGGALQDDRVLQIGLALADALAHAHARGVIHRDVKPQNVLVPREAHDVPAPQRGVPAVAKLTDFGGALMTGDDILTRTGDVLGTLAYMAPEQSDGAEVGAPADLYSLALILYEAFAGENPVRGRTPAETAKRIGSVLPSLAGARPELPRELTRGLDQALVPQAGERGTLDQLRGALVRALEQGDPALQGRRSPATAQMPARSLLHRGGERRDASHAGGRRAARAYPAASAARQAQLADQPAAEHRDHAVRDARAYRALAQGPPAGEEDRPSAPAGPMARRLGLAAALGLVAWQAWSGRPGVSLLLAAALAPVFLAPAARSAPSGGAWEWFPGAKLLGAALAPLLGLAGLAGAFPAIAGQAARWRSRALLGALGYWWLTLSEPLVGHRLWLGAPSATPPRAVWEGSISSAASHVLAPLLGFGVLLGALLWATGAVCLPLLVRGRRAALDVVAVTVWSASLAAAAPMLDRGLSNVAAHPSPRGAVLGAVMGGLLAVAARALRGPV
jgi:hypothetical protein